MEKFLKKYHFDMCVFDGCQYGLTTLDGAQPMRKPWPVMCLNSRLHLGLNAQCDRSHEHSSGGSKDLTATQMYTQEIANIVHQCISNDARRPTGASGGHSETHAAPLMHARSILSDTYARMTYVDTGPCVYATRMS